MGFITTDDFTNADILEATYPAVAKRLYGDWTNDPAIPIVTGFLGKVLLNCCCIHFPAEEFHNLVYLNQYISMICKHGVYVSLIVGLEILRNYHLG